MIVAIDGPAGAGKSSVSAAVAERLGFQLIDTGALYRCVGLLGMREGTSLEDGERLAALASTIEARFEMRDGVNHVILGDEDVTAAIRTEEASDAASRVSALGPVRDALLELQRSLGKAGDCVMEGRDIGTVVFPNADVKVYLTAKLRVRAERRLKDYEARGEPRTVKEVESEIAARDERDMNRPVAPLKQADDAVELDTTEMGFEQVVAHITAMVRPEPA